MQLSKETLAVLKNFASINDNILLKPGSKLATISAQKNIMASMTVGESFEQEFGIYNLNEFLGALSLFGEPELEFNDKFVLLSEGRNSIKFFAADPSVLVVPTKEINFPSADVEFTLSQEDLNVVLRTASILRAPDVAIDGNGSRLSVIVSDKKNETSNKSVIDIGETEGNFRVNLKVENLKLIPGEYNVSLSSKRISRFSSTSSDLVYYVAIEADSSFA
jgi:hypothetical protein